MSQSGLPVTDEDWFSVRPCDHGVTVISEPLHVEQVSSFLVEGRDQAVLIDTGMGVADLRAVVERLTARPVIVVNSHAHWDHIGSNGQFDEIWIHAAEAAALEDGIGNAKLRRALAPGTLIGSLPSGVDVSTLSFPPTPATRRLEDGDRIELGDRTLEVLHCPGHSPGGIALVDRAHRLLFTTDVAYAGVLYANDPADLPMYAVTLARLAGLVPDIDVAFGSHNQTPFAPGLLVGMVEGVRQIIAGRQPDWRQDDIDRHDFGGFGVQVWGNPVRGEESAP